MYSLRFLLTPFLCTGPPFPVYFLYTVGFSAFSFFDINTVLSLFIKKKKKKCIRPLSDANQEA